MPGASKLEDCIDCGTQRYSLQGSVFCHRCHSRCLNCKMTYDNCSSCNPNHVTRNLTDIPNCACLPHNFEKDE